MWILLQGLKFEKKSDIFLNIGKISIVTFFAIMIFGHFVPYFENTPNSYVYGLQSMRFFEGPWDYSNELLTENGEWHFVPGSWKKTIHDTAVPKFPPGLPFLGSIFYNVGDIAGLFFIGPIFAVVLLIISERIATNLFGKYVGFLTLLFLATNGYIFTVGQHLLTDNIFAILTTVGFFYVIKFLYNRDYRLLLFASGCLSLSPFFRLSGIIFLPIEIIIIATFFVFLLIKNNEKINSKFNNLRIADLSKSIIVIGIPWLIFILFFISFNNYYFGDPFITFYNIPGDHWVKPGTGNFLSIFEPTSSNLETIERYSNSILPYPLYRIQILDLDTISQERDDILTSSLLVFASGIVGKNILGFISLAIISLTITYSFISKNKKFELIIFGFVIVTSIIFWSANHVQQGRDSFMNRYMLYTFPIFSMMFSFLIMKILTLQKFEIRNTVQRKISKIVKIFVLIILVMFLIIAIYNSAPSQLIKSETEFQNTNEVLKYYPLDFEGLDEDSIIVGGIGSKVLDYGAIPFNSNIGQKLRVGFNADTVDTSMINNLNSLIQNEHRVFLFKEIKSPNEKPLRENLVEIHNFKFIDFSDSFCQIKLMNDEEIKNPTKLKESDEICFGSLKNEFVEFVQEENE